MPPPPSIDRIRDDDHLLDALGQRVAEPHDELSAALGGWARSIDDDMAIPLSPAAARVARRRTLRRRGLRGAAVLAVCGLTLSGTSVAAAVTDTHWPVLSRLGSLTQRLLPYDFDHYGPALTDDAAPQPAGPTTTWPSSPATSDGVDGTVPAGGDHRAAVPPEQQVPGTADTHRAAAHRVARSATTPSPSALPTPQSTAPVPSRVSSGDEQRGTALSAPTPDSSSPAPSVSTPTPGTSSARHPRTEEPGPSPSAPTPPTTRPRPTVPTPTDSTPSTPNRTDASPHTEPGRTLTTAPRPDLRPGHRLQGRVHGLLQGLGSPRVLAGGAASEHAQGRTDPPGRAHASAGTHAQDQATSRGTSPAQRQGPAASAGQRATPTPSASSARTHASDRAASARAAGQPEGTPTPSSAEQPSAESSSAEQPSTDTASETTTR